MKQESDLDLFEDAEIVFGCEEVMSYTLQEIMAYQSKLLDRIRMGDSTAKEKLIGRVEKGDVRLFVARTQLSHEKVYLLSAADGRKRQRHHGSRRRPRLFRH